VTSSWFFLSTLNYDDGQPYIRFIKFSLQHMVFCTQLVDGWWSWEPLRQLFFSAGFIKPYWCDGLVLLSLGNFRMPNRQKKSMHIETLRESYTKPSHQYGLIKPAEKNNWRSGSQDHHPSTNWVKQTICCNLKSSAPDDGRMRPKHVELRKLQ